MSTVLRAHIKGRAVVMAGRCWLGELSLGPWRGMLLVLRVGPVALAMTLLVTAANAEQPRIPTIAEMVRDTCLKADAVSAEVVSIMSSKEGWEIRADPMPEGATLWKSWIASSIEDESLEVALHSPDGIAVGLLVGSALADDGKPIDFCTVIGVASPEFTLDWLGISALTGEGLQRSIVLDGQVAAVTLQFSRGQPSVRITRYKN